MKSSTTRNYSQLTAAIAGLIALATAATTDAAVVTWSAATSVFDENDVSTTGSLVGAFNLGAFAIGPNSLKDTTVNSVPFTALVVGGGGASSGNFSLTSGGSLQAFNLVPTMDSPFADLSSSYKSLLATLAGIASPNPFTLTISGLTIGQPYEFQFWDSNYQAGQGHVTATAGNSVTLADNVTAMTGGLGQFAIGTFTADNSEEHITFSSTDFGNINGFQVRVLPEPAVAAFLCAGAMILCGRRRVPQAADRST